MTQRWNKEEPGETAPLRGRRVTAYSQPAAPVSLRQPSRFVRVRGLDTWLGAGLLDDLFATRFLWASDCGRLRFAALGESRRVSYQDLGSSLSDAADELDLPDAAAARLPLGLFVLGQTDERPAAFESAETETGARCWIPRVVLLQDNDGLLIFAADACLRDEIERRFRSADGTAGAAGLRPNGHGCRPDLRETTVDSSQTWERRVQAALDGIERGRLKKLVVSRRLAFAPKRTVFSPWASSWEVGRATGRIGFSVSTDRGRSMFVAATPETLLRVRDRALQTHALAGTFRGSASIDDFLASGKLTAEHAYVMDGLLGDLAPFVCNMRPGAIRVRRAGLVTHLETPFTADLLDDADPLQVLSALHPTAAIGGLPRSSALDALAAIEPYSRGWFAAPVGWMAANGDLHAAIAIRSLWITPEKAVALAGAGIVRGSIAAREWDETESKFDNMRAVIRGQLVAE